MLAGTLSGAFAQWYLVWLFARTGGGAASVGAYSTVLAFATPIFIVGQMGLRTIFVSSAERWPWKTYVCLRWCGVGVGAVILGLVVVWHPSVSLILGLAILSMKVAAAVCDLELARVQYGGDLRLLGGLVLCNGVGTIVVATCGTLIFGRVEAGVFGSGVVSVLVAGWAWRCGRKVAYEFRRQSGLRRILGASLPVTSSQLLASLLFQLPILFLGLWGDVRAVGLYAGAAYLLVASELVGSTLQTVLITPFRRLFATSGREAVMMRALSWSWRVVGFGVPVAMLVVLVGPWFLGVLYGPEFTLDRRVIALLCIGAVATPVGYILSVSLTVFNQYARVTIAMGASCLGLVAVAGMLRVLGLDPLLVATCAAAAGAVIRVSVLAFTAWKR